MIKTHLHHAPGTLCVEPLEEGTYEVTYEQELHFSFYYVLHLLFNETVNIDGGWP